MAESGRPYNQGLTEGISVAPVEDLDLDGKGVEIQGRELLMRKG
jgi:hypothetical protein